MKTRQSKFWDIHDSMTSQERNQEHKPGPVRMDKVGKLILMSTEGNRCGSCPEDPSQDRQ